MRKFLLIVALFTASVMLTFAGDSAEKSWGNYVPVNDPKLNPNQLAWIEGDWKRIAVTEITKTLRDGFEFRGVELIEISKYDYVVNMHPDTGFVSIVIGGVAYGSATLPENQRMIYPTMGYYKGAFCLGPDVQSDTFDLRVPAGKNPNFFAIKNRDAGDILVFERVPVKLKSKEVMRDMPLPAEGFEDIESLKKFAEDSTSEVGGSEVVKLKDHEIVIMTRSSAKGIATTELVFYQKFATRYRAFLISPMLDGKVRVFKEDDKLVVKQYDSDKKLWFELFSVKQAPSLLIK